MPLRATISGWKHSHTTAAPEQLQTSLPIGSPPRNKHGMISWGSESWHRLPPAHIHRRSAVASPHYPHARIKSRHVLIPCLPRPTSFFPRLPVILPRLAELVPIASSSSTGAARTTSAVSPSGN